MNASPMLILSNFFFLAISFLPMRRTVKKFAMQNIITIMEMPNTIVSSGAIVLTSINFFVSLYALRALCRSVLDMLMILAVLRLGHRLWLA